MTDFAIRTRGLGKRYQLGGQERYNALRDELARLPRTLLSYVGGATSPAARKMPKHLWAVQGVDLEIKPGEVVGIIGSNGAGKSTLLKLLSRITAPTVGEAWIRGRVGSLLEVGTGFHPELSGRENVFVNGTVLGMTRREIARKLDEIVAFADVEEFLDTPVKRYSSGMRMRLAFSVAAHLEAEIMFVDEVLAVGDAQFQKKCFERMGTVARSGRTILVVSHQMESIEQLCDRAIWMKSGSVHRDGQSRSVVHEYLATTLSLQATHDIANRRDRLGAGPLRFTSLALLDPRGRPTPVIAAGDDVTFRVGYDCGGVEPRNVEVAIWIRDQMGRGMACFYTKMKGADFPALPTRGFVDCHVPRMPLVPGTYRVDMNSNVRGERSDKITDVAAVQIVSGDFFGSGYRVDKYGAILCDHSWKLVEDGELRAQMLQGAPHL